MKKSMLLSIILIAITTLSSCFYAGEVFKAGMWWGIIVVVFVLFLVLWLFRQRNGRV